MTSTKSDSTSSSRPNLKCSICGKEFENLGDLQRHTTVEHLQKGELPSGSKDAWRGERRRTTITRRLLQSYYRSATGEDFQFPLSDLFVLLKFSNRPVESYLAVLKPNTRDFRIIARTLYLLLIQNESILRTQVTQMVHRTMRLTKLAFLLLLGLHC